jgi:metallo-beta-lactamase family protein
MKISFHGACREVTGSCILIESEDAKFLVDCGMFQGDEEEKNLKDFSFDPKDIDFVLLTHAHLDHCGRLPKLFMDGFRGRIYSTAPTRDLTEIILLDALKISREEGKVFVAPLCTEADIFSLTKFFTCLEYGEEKKINDSVTVRLRDAGHVLGSSIFEVWLKEEDKEKKLVFSGDLGNPPAPIVKDPEFLSGADVVFVESTYGDRLHEPKDKGREVLKKKIGEIIEKQGVLMIPVFALERTQELLYELNNWVENQRIPYVPVFLDSPLAIRATGIYKKYPEFYDSEAKALAEKGDDLFDFKGLLMINNPSQSGVAERSIPPKIILAGSGMFEGGRIKGYLRKYLGDSSNTLLIISYQPEGSLGRKLINGEKVVEIEGKKIQVRAEVTPILSFSSHADQLTLLNWVDAIKNPKPKKVFIVHGEEKAGQSFATILKGVVKTDIIVPLYGSEYEI